MFEQPVQIGPLRLRNRTIRAAAFEGMSRNHGVTDELIQYHTSVARGGIGMTTVAYAAVCKSGLSFPHQLWMRREILPELKKLTDAIHAENAAASIQLGHCGNMAKRSVIGSRPLSASTHINLYAPSFPKKMSHKEIEQVATDFGNAVLLAREAGFDAVEIHAGHGYLISQFLSPHINKRKDEYGGSLENRMRFLEKVLTKVMEAAQDKTAVLVKMNLRDGFKGGVEMEESLQVAQKIQELGAHALVLSGGYVSKAPMYVMRGKMPLKTLARGMNNPLMGLFVRLFGNLLIPDVPFKENYFMEDARIFRKNLKMPLVYVGGILSKENIEEAMHEGFDAVAIARALIRDPDFVNRILEEKMVHSSCDTCNHCIAVMYNGPFKCIQHTQA
ncbi:MAG: NADH:flavin oxidoreductase [Flavobacteriales bacterium]|nr:NADH:flavin oxidoreductase [Flavobacteriales bacterium]